MKEGKWKRYFTGYNVVVLREHEQRWKCSRDLISLRWLLGHKKVPPDLIDCLKEALDAYLEGGDGDTFMSVFARTSPVGGRHAQANTRDKEAFNAERCFAAVVGALSHGWSREQSFSLAERAMARLGWWCGGYDPKDHEARARYLRGVYYRRRKTRPIRADVSQGCGALLSCVLGVEAGEDRGPHYPKDAVKIEDDGKIHAANMLTFDEVTERFRPNRELWEERGYIEMLQRSKTTRVGC